MSEIEILYNIARIPKYGKRQCKDSEYLECQKYCFCDMDNKCDKFVVEYPPFTAEKQIELIKILAKGEVKINNEDGEYEFSVIDTISDFSSFEESLAGVINKLWTDMSKEEHKQIKEILK